MEYNDSVPCRCGGAYRMQTLHKNGTGVVFLQCGGCYHTVGFTSFQVGERDTTIQDTILCAKCGHPLTIKTLQGEKAAANVLFCEGHNSIIQVRFLKES